MLLPTGCSACGRPGASPCEGCRAGLRPAVPGPAPRGVDVVHALLSYEGAGRELVAGLKFRNRRGALPWMADGLADLTRGRAHDVITWVPASRRRRAERGFDQAELLARALARRLRLPARRLLARGPGPPQTGRSRAERSIGPRLVPAGRLRRGAAVLLVDDVLTTGATASVAALVLAASGAARIELAVAARTP